MKSEKLKKVIAVCFLLIAIIAASIFGTYNYVKKKATVDLSGWTGSFEITNGDHGKQKLLNVFCENNKYTYEINENGSRILSEGDVVIEGENHIGLYDGELRKATVFFSNEKFYLIKENTKVKRISKISNEGMSLHR